LKIELTHRGIIVGEIFPTIASRITKELTGLLVPSKEYHEICNYIHKHNEIYQNLKANKMIDRFLDKLLEKKYINLKRWFSEFQINVDEKPITDTHSEIRIIDNMTKTGLGNKEITIHAWNLNTDNIYQDFKIYSIKYLYPSEPKNIIEIKHRSEIVLNY
jgi:hypothetical protein